MELLIIRFLLFVLPFVVLRFGTSYFETPKVIAAELCIQLLFVIAVWKNILHMQKPARYWPFVALTAVSVVHLLISSSAIGWFGNSFRLQGTFLLWHLMLFAVIVSMVDTKAINMSIPVVTVVLLALSTVAFGTNAAGRAIGPAGEPNAFAAIAVFCFPFAFLSTPKKLLRGLLVLCMVVILYTSHSRSGLCGWLIEIIFLWYMHTKSAKIHHAVLICLGVMVLMMLLPLFESPRVYENRLEIWTTALYAGTQYPLLGWGMGNIEGALAWGAEVLRNTLRFQYVDSAHNILLDWWLMGGAIGFGCMAYLINKTFRAFVYKHNKPETAALLGLFTALLFNPTSVCALIGFWWLIGRGFGEKR